MDLSTCKKSYIARSIDGKLYNNITNYGMNPHDTAIISRSGEYNGFEIESLELILPLFTSYNISKAYELLLNEKHQEIVTLLRIEKEYAKYGNDVIHYIISKWCSIANVVVPKNIENVSIEDNNLDKRIKLCGHDAIINKIKIASVGYNEKNNESVVPLEWTNKIFESGNDLHEQMNKLPSRINKPPVTFCCTYNMSISSNNKFRQWDELESEKQLEKYDYIILIKTIGYAIKSSIVPRENFKDNIHDYKILFLSKASDKQNTIILIDKKLHNKNKQKCNDYNTSYLSSFLQKCFRRENESYLLKSVIYNLHNSKGYNLPEQHFAKVSGPKQLFWRSFISIIEDVHGYDTSSHIDLLDLMCLSLVSHIDPNFYLKKEYLKHLCDSLLYVQQIQETWKFRNYDEFIETKDQALNLIKIEQNRNKLSFLLAIGYMPMMRGDFRMLSKCYDMLSKNPDMCKNINTSNKIILNYDNISAISVKMCALDMHCKPMILIYLQASLPFIPSQDETLEKLSHFIWNNSSRYNSRIDFKYIFSNDNGHKILNALYEVQYALLNENIYYESDYDWICKNKQKTIEDKSVIGYEKRTAFLLLFGKKFRIDKKIKNKQYDAIIAGTISNPIKIKRTIQKGSIEYILGPEKQEAIDEFIKNFKTVDIDTKYLNPPHGYKWKKIGIHKINIKNDNNIKFYVDDIETKVFDASSLIEKISEYETNEIPEDLKETLDILFYRYDLYIFSTIMKCYYLNKIRTKYKDNRIFNWTYLTKYIPRKIFLYARSRIFMSDVVQIGPVDRSGQKTHNSISYQYEGVLWRIMSAFVLLYPDVVKPISLHNFKINKSTYGYVHLIDSINKICADNKLIKYENIIIPVLKSDLWNHQKNTSDKIIEGLTINKKRGFGDASDVGSGKTLTALNISYELMKYCKNNKLNISNKGVLVMLPSEHLYDTWKNEIKKHYNFDTKSKFNMIIQNSKGVLIDNSSNKKVNINEIEPYSIVITTMGRCRDSQIINNWLLVIIDECLTIQNKQALQTEEAWRQSSYSYFGVVMLSATFFRSRFDKMMYMLSMLNTQMPLTPDYLDTILSESIVCNLSDTQRTWIIDKINISLTNTKKDEYQKILLKNNDEGYEKVYRMLQQFICNYIDPKKIVELVKHITNKYPNSKILIYAQSKDYADQIAKLSKNIGRYPEKKKHVVVSYTEGTYGLNDLIDYNTILSKIPEPDKIPQMKGRLDRPGQNNNTLRMIYMYVEDTIDEAGLYKIEIANNFYKNHIMPLAEFYKLAVLNQLKIKEDISKDKIK